MVDRGPGGEAGEDERLGGGGATDTHPSDIID